MAGVMQGTSAPALGKRSTSADAQPVRRNRLARTCVHEATCMDGPSSQLE